VTVSKDGARYQPVAWWFTKRRLGRELRKLYQAIEEVPPQLLALVRKLEGEPDNSLEAKAKDVARRGIGGDFARLPVIREDHR
jgi:hypothetical protein